MQTFDMPDHIKHPLRKFSFNRRSLHVDMDTFKPITMSEQAPLASPIFDAKEAKKAFLDLDKYWEGRGEHFRVI